MIALQMHQTAPAQFVFDRGALCQQPGLLAAVVSASEGEREQISALVQQQVAEQLGLKQLSVVQTVVEKRATFACLPNTFEGPDHEGVKPDAFVAPHIFACGDFVRGPYPSTLEGAVRSGLQVVRHLG
jgi:predicted NAD/FAD-dependent oxidoreductase